jgi:tetratricopeptide (TPR) repeat protein
MRRMFLMLCALLFAAPAHAEWWEARTDHFKVYSESSAQDAKAFAAKLERFDMALRSLQTIPSESVRPDAERLTVYRFGDTDDIGRLAGGAGVAGFYIPRLGGSVAFTPAKADRVSSSIVRRDSRTELDPMTVLLHEYTHHFMFQHFPAAYPSWYIEGFAETAATIDMHDDGSFHVGNPPQYRADALFSPMMNLSATQMLTGTERPNIVDVYGHYTVGWLLNHYLSFSGERPGQLTAYLRLINQGTSPADAARKAFGDLGKLDRDLLRYKTSRKLGGADVKPAHFAPPTVSMRKLTPAEEAVMMATVRTKRGVTLKKAGDVAADAEAVAQRFPNSYPVWLETAEAELDAEHFPQAAAAADRALAANPNSADAMVLRGRVALEQGKANKQLMPEARSWFAKAYAIDKHDPSSLFYNYMTYFHEGAAIPESALIGLERAYQMAMYDQEVRLVLGRQLLSENKGSLAKSIIQPLALNPHESKRAKSLDEVIALIDQNKVGEAHTMLAAKMKEWEEKAKKGD